jgi:hypothetical protein
MHAPNEGGTDDTLRRSARAKGADPEDRTHYQESAMENPRKLRELAGWYREFAERAGNPAIWHARLTTAEDLEREADRLEKIAAGDQGGIAHWGRRA